MNFVSIQTLLYSKAARVRCLEQGGLCSASQGIQKYQKPVLPFFTLGMPYETYFASTNGIGKHRETIYKQTN
jgi:hypothetical protein